MRQQAKKLKFILRIIVLCWFFLALGSACTPLKKVSSTKGSKLVTEQYSVLKKNENIRQGPYAQYYNGVKQMEGNYDNNERTGLWQFYGYDGKLNFSGSYKKGRYVDKWTYYLNGDVSAVIHYNDDHAPDSARGFVNGRLSYQMQHDNKTGSGLARSYYIDGNLKENIPLKDRRPNGKYQFYFENGVLHREVEYENGRLKNLLTDNDLTGLALASSSLKDGNGVLNSYFLPESASQTTLALFSVKTYSQGLLNGHCTYYRKNGKKDSEGEFRNNVRVGDWIHYDENGVYKNTMNHDQQNEAVAGDLEFNVLKTEYEEAPNEKFVDFPGGEKERVNFIIKTVIYPKHARETGTGGRVFAEFRLSLTGEVTSVKITKSVEPQFDNEVIRLVRSMPRWEPRLINGIPVRISYSMPINFKIQ